MAYQLKHLDYIFFCLVTMFYSFRGLADQCAERVGNYFLARWRVILSLVASVGAVYALCRYTPSLFPTLLLALGDFLLLTLPAYFERVQVRSRAYHHGSFQYVENCLAGTYSSMYM